MSIKTLIKIRDLGIKKKLNKRIKIYRKECSTYGNNERKDCKIRKRSIRIKNEIEVKLGKGRRTK